MEIKLAETEEELNELLQMEYEVTAVFRPYAEKIGIEDKPLKNYTIENSKKYLSDKYIRYIAYEKEKIVGMVIIRKAYSDYDGKEIIEIVDLYVKPHARKKGFGKNDFYKHIGGKALETVYSFDVEE